MASTDYFPPTVAEMFAQITTSGVVTLNDRRTMKAVVLKESLSDEERQVLDRLLYAIRKGRIRLLDKIIDNGSSALAN